MHVLLAIGCLARALAGSGNDDLDKFIENAMTSGKIGGLSATVVKGDQMLWTGAYGSTQPGNSSAPLVTEDTAFMFASLSKTNIAIATFVLYEKGLLNYTDDVNKYLDFEVRNPNFKDDAITLHHLLTHTSSISDKEYNKLSIYFAGDPGISLHDTVYGYLASQGRWATKGKSYSTKTAPGKKYDYSNIGACLMAYICEVVAVKAGLAADFDDFVRKSIHQPLGIDLNEVGYLAKDFPSLKPGPYAMPSINTGKKWLNCETYAVMDYPTCDWRSSSKNYAKMLGMFIQDGTYQGKQILQKETVQYMKQKSEVSGGSETCSNALWLYESNLLPGYAEVLGHDGSDAGISTYAYFNPETGVGYVLLTNADQDGSGSVDKQSTNIGSKLMNTFDTKAKLTAGLELDEDSLRKQRHVKSKSNSAGNPGTMDPPGCGDWLYSVVV